jgi:hypothetical protein
VTSSTGCPQWSGRAPARLPLFKIDHMQGGGKRREVADIEHRRNYRQSSSASRFTAGAFGFLTLIQCAVRPER